MHNGLHHYGGWFFLVGEIVAAGSGISGEDSPYFRYFFTRSGPCPEGFRAGPKISIEFEAHFKWVLKESWDSDLRAGRSKGPGKASITPTVAMRRDP